MMRRQVTISLLMLATAGVAQAAPHACFVSSSVFHVSGQGERSVSETVRITAPTMDKCVLHSAQAQAYFQRLAAKGRTVTEDRKEECHSVC